MMGGYREKEEENSREVCSIAWMLKARGAFEVVREGEFTHDKKQ